MPALPLLRIIYFYALIFSSAVPFPVPMHLCSIEIINVCISFQFIQVLRS